VWFAKMAEQNVDILNEVSAETSKTLGLLSEDIVENVLRDIDQKLSTGRIE